MSKQARLPCKHEVCHEVADGTCHFNADGWIINKTPAVEAALRRRILLPNDELARKIREQVSEKEFVRMAREILADPTLTAKDRKRGEAMLDDLRRLGMPGD